MSSTRLSIAVAVAMTCPPAMSALAETVRSKPIELAQAPPLSEAEKAKLEQQRKREQQKGPPPGAQQGKPEGRGGPPPQQQGRQDGRGGPPPPQQQQQQIRQATPPPPPPPPPPKIVQPPPRIVQPPPVLRQLPPSEKKVVPVERTPATNQVPPPQERRFDRQQGSPDTARGDRGPQGIPPRDGGRQRDADRIPPGGTTPGIGKPPAVISQPPVLKNAPVPTKAVDQGTSRTPPPAFLPTQPPKRPLAPVVGTAPPVLKFDAVKSGRKERTEDGGKRTVIVEPGVGNRVIIKQNNRTFIHHDESARFKRLHADAQTRRRPDGNSETFFVRGDGVRVVTVTDRNGRLVHRYRRDRSGREFSIIDNRRFLRNAGIAAGIGALGVAIALSLPPPRVAIARERYIVDYDRASDDDLYEALSAPPIERLERSYSLDEVRYSYDLRQRMRRVELDTITFEFGSWTVANEQFQKLERMARAMRRMLERNPNEVFLIGAHTDAVGGEEDNLSLSDRRAEAVAQVLTEEFGVPAENLVTQGYGEQHLRVQSREAEPRNRRVEVQRITPLMSEEQQR